MASMWRRAMVYLGLQDDPEGYEYDYDGYEAYEDDDASAHAPTHAVATRATRTEVAVDTSRRRSGRRPSGGAAADRSPGGRRA